MWTVALSYSVLYVFIIYITFLLLFTLLLLLLLYKIIYAKVFLPNKLYKILPINKIKTSSSPVVFIGYGMELHNPWTTRSTFDYHGQSHYHCSRPKDFLAPSHLYPFFIPLPLFHIFSFV